MHAQSIGQVPSVRQLTVEGSIKTQKLKKTPRWASPDKGHFNIKHLYALLVLIQFVLYLDNNTLQSNHVKCRSAEDYSFTPMLWLVTSCLGLLLDSSKEAISYGANLTLKPLSFLDLPLVTGQPLAYRSFDVKKGHPLVHLEAISNQGMNTVPRWESLIKDITQQGFRTLVISESVHHIISHIPIIELAFKGTIRLMRDGLVNGEERRFTESLPAQFRSRPFRESAIIGLEKASFSLTSVAFFLMNQLCRELYVDIPGKRGLISRPQGYLSNYFFNNIDLLVDTFKNLKPSQEPSTLYPFIKLIKTYAKEPTKATLIEIIRWVETNPYYVKPLLEKMETIIRDHLKDIPEPYKGNFHTFLDRFKTGDPAKIWAELSPSIMIDMRHESWKEVILSELKNLDDRPLVLLIGEKHLVDVLHFLNPNLQSKVDL